MSGEMFAWLHLINQVTDDCTGARNSGGHAVLVESSIVRWLKNSNQISAIASFIFLSFSNMILLCYLLPYLPLPAHDLMEIKETFP